MPTDNCDEMSQQQQQQQHQIQQPPPLKIRCATVDSRNQDQAAAAAAAATRRSIESQTDKHGDRTTPITRTTTTTKTLDNQQAARGRQTSSLAVFRRNQSTDKHKNENNNCLAQLGAQPAPVCRLLLLLLLITSLICSGKRSSFVY